MTRIIAVLCASSRRRSAAAASAASSVGAAVSRHRRTRPATLSRIQMAPPAAARTECARGQRRLFSSTAASAAAAVPAAAPAAIIPRIISRRALDHHLPRHPQLVRPPPPRSAKKPDDSSWPLPMRIAGYVALGLTVPYTVATLIAGSSEVRDVLEGDRPDVEDDHEWGKWVVQLVREYWGVGEGWAYVDWWNHERRAALEEWGPINSGVAEKAAAVAAIKSADGESDDDDNKEQMSFESELPHLSSAVRHAQIEIERLRHSPLLTRITLNPEGDMGMCAERTLEGDVPADARVLRKLMADIGVTGGGAEGEEVPVAVDFVDEETAAAVAAAEVFDAAKAIGEGGELVVTEDAGGEHPAARELRQKTYNMSAWHYVPDAPTSAAPASSATGSSASSSSSGSDSASASSAASSSSSGGDHFTQLRLKELDDKAGQLALDLKDPNCTRDVDDMREELRRVKAEARKLRGWSGTVRGWFGRS